MKISSEKVYFILVFEEIPLAFAGIFTLGQAGTRPNKPIAGDYL